MSSILPQDPDSNTNQPDWLTPPMRELADGLAQYLDAFMGEVVCDAEVTLDVDYQYLAEDFVESCVIDEMQVDDCGHHSWAGLMRLLDEHWPDDIFPTRYEDDPKRDAGPRIVSLMRWIDELRAKVARVEAEILEEETYRAEDPSWEVSVLIPVGAGDEVADRIFEAVADAAYEAEPEDRTDWDIFVSATKNPTYVMAHLLRRALDGDA